MDTHLQQSEKLRHFSLAIAALVLPLLDTALSVLLGALMAFLAAKVSKGALGQNIVTGLFLVVVFYFSFNVLNCEGSEQQPAC